MFKNIITLQRANFRGFSHLDGQGKDENNYSRHDPLKQKQELHSLRIICPGVTGSADRVLHNGFQSCRSLIHTNHNLSEFNTTVIFHMYFFYIFFFHVKKSNNVLEYWQSLHIVMVSVRTI